MTTETTLPTLTLHQPTMIFIDDEPIVFNFDYVTVKTNDDLTAEEI